jgi:hypothetical protein
VGSRQSKFSTPRVGGEGRVGRPRPPISSRLRCDCAELRNNGGAECASAGCRRYLAQAFWTFFRNGRWGFRFVAVHKTVYWQNQKEVDHRRKNDEREQVIDEIAYQKPASIDLKAERREVRHTTEHADERRDDVSYQRFDDRPKRRADDDGNGQIHHIAAKQELSKSVHLGAPGSNFRGSYAIELVRSIVLLRLVVAMAGTTASD